MKMEEMFEVKGKKITEEYSFIVLTNVKKNRLNIPINVFCLTLNST